MSASPCRTRLSSMVRVSLCSQYGQRGQGTSSAATQVEVHSLVGVACHHGILVPNVLSCCIWSNGNHVQGSLLCWLGVVVCSWDSP